MKSPKVAIIICSYNQKELLDKCLENLKKTTYTNYRTYLVDDSGKGEIADRIKKKSKGIKIIVNKKNLGFAGANNVGIRKSIPDYNPDYFLLLSDDTEIIDKNWLNKMIEITEKDKNIGISGCRVLYPDKSLQWVAKKGKIYTFTKAGYFEKSEELLKNQKVNEIVGACFLVRKEVVKQIGLIDEKFNPAYGEESDFCFRAARKGFTFLYIGNTEIIHHGAASTKSLTGIWQIKKRNAIRLEWLNYSPLNIIKYTIIHFGSAIFHDSPFKRLKMLLKAYKENFNNLKEIKKKRKERNSWEKSKK